MLYFEDADSCNVMGRGSDKKLVPACLLSFFLTGLILLSAFVITGLIPFGNDALIYKDGQQQMIDLFCWFKDVLSGRSSIDYSFTKYLGGSNYAVFTYYLSSPFNLLIVFFDKTQIPMFIDVLYLLKTSLAALFACFCLCGRFRPASRTKYAVTVLLAVSYALGQYMIAQSSNMMWLDGVYMLPLILAGVGKLISDKKSSLFIVSAALALCFNWYTGITDLMFAGIWFLFESLRTTDRTSLKAFGASVLRFALACVSVLLISAAILLPTLTLLSGRTYGSSGIGMLLDFSMIGFVPGVISNYVFGFASVKGSVNLFAGSFVLIGVILLFFSSLKLKDKLVYGLLLLFVVMSFYWQPLVALFSMLRTVEGFWYRYAYIGIFTLVYLAAVFYLESDTSKIKLYLPPCIAAMFCVIVVLISVFKPASVADNLFAARLSESLMMPNDRILVPLIAKMVFPVLVSVLFSIVMGLKRGSSTAFRAGAVLLSAVIFLELLLNQMVLGKTYSTGEGPAISRYSANEAELLNRISDPSFFRVVQTSYHSRYNGLSSSYSEPMAYGFNSVTAFVSAPDENAVYFLDRAGYPQYYDTIPVTASENLALDSLLAVKYILLPAGDDNNTGIEKVGGIDGFKDLYLNRYAAPAAFVVSGTGSFESDGKDPALYLNGLYRRLSGIEKDVFIPITASDSSADGRSHSYRLESADDGSVIYAEFVTDSKSGATLYMNGEKNTEYATEMAPKMVRVKTVDGNSDLRLEFYNDDGQIIEARFYRLDLKTLAETTSAMKANAASQTVIKDGHCSFEVANAASGTSLFTSVPYSKGWTVTRNGKRIDPDLTGEVLMTIPLEEGKNVIEMDYRVPNKTAGLAATAAGVILFAGITVFENRKKTVSN